MVVSWWPQIITNWDNFPIQFSQSRGCISSLQCFGGSLTTTDCLLTVNWVPHLLHKNDWDISTTSSVSISGGMLAKENIEFLKNLKISKPIVKAIKYSIT